MRVRALVALAMLLVVAAVASAATPTLVIRGDSKLGSFAVKSDGSLAGAIQAFGEPTTTRHDRIRGACRVKWRPIGLRIQFYNLAGKDACDPRYGRFAWALITARRWRTAKGLRIGDSTTRLMRLHRPTLRVGAWWLIVVRPGPGPYPGLAAKVYRGRVSAFRVTYAAGGD